MTPTPGTRLGRYELLERLAVGGMAEIFLARAAGIEGFEKLVVCKCILAQRASDDEFVKMFADEARLAAQLHHPNVAHVFDIGREGNLHFFAMEYIHGADVHEILQAARAKGPVPLEQALAIIIGVAAGLHYAHEKTGNDGQPLGIVHRDVSPSNVLVSFDGSVKVVDFGIAKATSQWARTRTGTIKGKASCMSPEQCRGETVDRRSDVFAVGILLYELTTGVRAFQGDSEYAIIRRIVDEDVLPPSVHRPDYPPALEAIVMRALSRKVDDRTATAQELQIDLETFAREQGLVLSSVELGRYMHELFGDRRPARAAIADEAFLHASPGAGGLPITSPTRSLKPPEASRARRWRVPGVAALVVALAGGAYLVAAQTRPPRPPQPDPRGDQALTTVMAPAPTVTPPDAPPEVGAAVTQPPTAGAAADRPRPRLVAPAPKSRRRAEVRRAAAARAPKSTTPALERDLDAPFPR